jgi:hypothetical protein
MPDGIPNFCRCQASFVGEPFEVHVLAGVFRHWIVGRAIAAATTEINYLEGWLY